MESRNTTNRSSDPYIVVDSLSHTYENGTRALDDVNVEIGVGLFGMLGANGAGKSTLLQIICTLLEPVAGHVTVGGHDVVKQRDEVRKLFGYLPQDFGMWGSQRIENVLDSLAALSGIEKKEARKRRITQALEAVGLLEVSRRKVKKLSGGMLRRLGVAQALVHDPKVLIMDEPTVALDPEERIRFRQMISQLSHDRIIILSTHIIADLGAGCSSMALIHEGRLEFTGTPGELISNARGKVFEVAVAREMAEELELKDTLEIVARSSEGDKTLLRGVDSEGLPVEGAKAVENITMEEAYLAFSLGHGRTIKGGLTDQALP